MPTGTHLLSKLTRRVKTLESQISELESEASRLLRSLDEVKESKAASERKVRKQADETAKQIGQQVGPIRADADRRKPRLRA